MDQHANMDVLLLRVKEEEDHWQQSQDHEVELFQTLRLQVEDLQRRLEEKDNKLIMANKVIRALRDEVQTLQKQLEQHIWKCHGDIIGQRGRLFQCGRGNDITTLPCVQIGTVPSACRPSEPRSQDFTSQNSQPLFPVVKIEDFGTPPNALLSCTAEDDPGNFSLSPDDDTLTPPQELMDNPAEFPLALGDCTLIRVISQQELKLPVLSVKLQDCRDLLGPDGVLKMEFEEGDDDDEDDGDDLCFEDDDDDSDYDPKSEGFHFCSENKEVLSPPEESITQPKGEQRRQSRGGKRIMTKTTLDKSHKYRECGKTFSYPSQKLSVNQRGHAGIKPITTAAPYDTSTDSPHENTSSNTANTGSPQEEDGDRANPISEPCKAKAEADLIRQHPTVHPRRTCGEKGNDRRVEYSVPYECDVCGRTLANKRTLIIHKRMHTGEKPYGCTQCGKTYRCSGGLRRHQRRHHFPGRLLQTALTRRKRGRPRKVTDDNLRDALHDYLHSREPPYACTQCDKTFKYRGSFLTHKAWHTGEKPYACTQCGKSFRFSSNLRNHQKKHHAQQRPSTESTNTRSCQEVGKSSTQSSGLNQIPTEKAPTASTPGSTSTDSCNTGSHQEVDGNGHANVTPEPCDDNHTAQANSSERPYACKHCNATFTHVSGRIHHEKSHSPKTGAKPAGLIQLRLVHPRRTCGAKENNRRKYVPHECDVCGLMLANKRNLVVHRRMHTGEKPYACTQCGNTFRSSSALRGHQKSRHLQDRPLQTALPLRKRGRPKKGTDHLHDTLHDHLHPGEKPHACTQCGKTFRNSSNLRVHQKKCHTQQRPSTEIPNTGSCQEVGQTPSQSNSDIQHPTINPRRTCGEKGSNRRKHRVPYECDVCGLKLASKQYLVVHKRRHTGERPYACTQCGKAFRYADNLRVHQKSQHTQPSTEIPNTGSCQEVGQTSTQSNSDIQHPTINPRRTCGKKGNNRRVEYHVPYECDVCGLMLSTKGNLVVHKRRHTGEMPYACTQCGKAFRYSNNLRAHQKSHHEEAGNNRRNEVPCECDICGKVISRKRNLIIHKRRHTGEKPYACTQCGNTFMSSNGLQIHQKLHNHLQEEPSGTEKRTDCKCDVCGKIFANSRNLRGHLKVHSGERPYACTQCDKTFKYRAALVAHKSVHTGEMPYGCGQCEKTFRSSSGLRAHQRRHHLQERPSTKYRRRYGVTFKCDICEKVFTNKKSLIIHNRRHTGEKPYACTL